VTQDDPAGGSGPSPVGAPAPSGAPAFTQEDFDRLRAENAQYAATLARLDPYVEDIKPILEDEEYRNAQREYRRVYSDLSQRKPNSLSPELQALRDEILGEIKPFKEAFQSQTAAQEDAKRQRVQRAFDEGKPIVLAHIERHPELRGSRAFVTMVEAMQSEAVERDVPFKQVWDSTMSAFGAPEPRQAPPRQLRANAGEQGIPAAPDPKRRAEADGRKPTVKEAFMDAFNRTKGKAS
jgi:hypothetical protein